MGKWHPLHTAAIGGNIVAVQKEFSRLGKGKRGNVLNDLQDSNGYTALHFAIQCGNLEVVKWMLDNGADVNLQSNKVSDEVTPLVIATSKGMEEVAKVLLETGANPRIGRAQDGFTPLHLCAKTNHCRLARLILEHVPNTVSVLTKTGQSCIDVARSSGSPQFITLVFSLFPEIKEGQLNSKSRRKKLNRPTKAAQTSSHSSGFDSRLGRTLIELTRNGSPQKLKEFLLRHPSVDLNWTMGKNGWTALMEVCATGNDESAQILLEGGADSEIRSKKGYTALHIAARYGHKQVLRVLLDRGACLAAVTPAGETVEEVASMFGQSAVFAFFVTYRAELIVMKHQQAIEQESAVRTQVDVSSEQCSVPPSPHSSLVSRMTISSNSAPSSSGLVAPTSPTSLEIMSAEISHSDTNDAFCDGSGDDFHLFSWLTVVGLGNYVNILQSNGFDSLGSLGMITTEDFAEMQFLLGHKRLLLSELAKLKDSHPQLFVPKTVNCCLSRDVSSDDLSRSNVGVGSGGGGGGGGSVNASASYRNTCGFSNESSFRSNSTTPDPEKYHQQGHRHHCQQQQPPAAQDTTVYAMADVLRREVNEIGNSSSTTSSLSDISFSTSELVTGNRSFQEKYNNSATDIQSDQSQLTMIKEVRYEELTIGRVIGEGSFGIVHFGTWRGMSVAVKALKISEGYSSLSSGSGNSSSDEEFLRHEARLMGRVCNHDHVIQFVGIVVRPSPCVVTIFCPHGSVEDLLVTSAERHSVKLEDVVRMAMEAARGVVHLHLEGVIHRDLAARNLLLDGHLHVRVGDFGFSRVKAAAVSKGYTKSDMGPIRWLAPEAMRKKIYSEASDVFSFGVVMYEMFWKCVPWAEFDTLDVAIRVCSGERMDISGSVGLPGALLAAIHGCWEHSAASRPELGEVLSYLEELYAERCRDSEQGEGDAEQHVEVDWGQHEGGIVEEVHTAPSLFLGSSPLSSLQRPPPESMYSLKLGNDVAINQI